MADRGRDDRIGTPAWFEIHADDIDRAAEFYRRVFAWSFEPLPGFALGSYLLITASDGRPAGGGLAHSPGRRPPGGEASIVYLHVRDVESGVKAAEAAGGTIHRPRMNIGGDHGHCAIVEDTEGNLLGLWADR